MKRLSPIPENFKPDPESDGQVAEDDLRALLDALKDAVSAPRAGERDLAAAAKALVQAAGALHTPNGASDYGPRLRLGVFLDTANLTDRGSDDPIRVDFAKLLAHVSEGRRIVHARAYCPIYADFNGRLEHQRSVAPVWDMGYDIVTKPIKVFSDGTRKADLDLVLVVDVIRRLPTMEVVALMSGDGDYVPMVEYLREHGVRVEVYSFADAIAEELRLAANAWHDISALKSVHVGAAPAKASRGRAGASARSA